MTETARTPDFTLPDILRQPRDKVRALQDRLLRETIEMSYRWHPYYRRLMQREGLEPRHIQNTDDLMRLPPTTKKDYLNDPEAFRLQGDDLPDDAITWKVIYSSGTTSGRPAPIYVAAFDHFAYLFGATRRQDFMGLRDTDVIANLFPLTPFPMGAYSRAPDEAAAVGAAIFNAHTGRAESKFPLHHGLDHAVRLIEKHRTTILWGVAGFVRRIIIRAQELGADFRTVRSALITGEASSAAMREDMRRRMRELGCAGSNVVNRFGSAEQGVSMVECQEGAGFHSLAPDQVFHEVLDPVSGKRLNDGESGMFAFTHIFRRGSLFLRYQVGDVVAMSHEPCPHCGRTCPRVISQPVRAGDIVKIKGMLVNLQVLKDQLDQWPDVDEYQIVVRSLDAADPFSMDELVVRIAAPSARRDATGAAIVERATNIVRVRPTIEFAEANDLYDPTTTTKPRRVVDLRPPKS